MRIHFKISASSQKVPFNYQELLTGVIHKWLGQNLEHGQVSLYSFSWLKNGRRHENGLKFENGTSFYFSSHNRDLVKRLVQGVFDSPELFHGLKVQEAIIQEDPDFKDRELFYAASPVFIKRKNGDKTDHILFDDPRANNFLKETLLTKLEQAGIENEGFEIMFDAGYRKAASKKITYKGIENRASICPVIIKGSNTLKQFAWNVGLGNSTGIGFGAIE
mgnify:CR=1 FL=1